MTIRVTDGAITCNVGRRRRIFTPSDGPLHLSPELEQRFVAKGVARYDEPEDPEPEEHEEVAESSEDEPEETASDDYETLTLGELKALCKERDIKTTGKPTKEQLIRALQEDDAPPVPDALGAE